jgi:hypothetical protein
MAESAQMMDMKASLRGALLLCAVVISASAAGQSAEPPAYQAAVFIGFDNTSERYVAHWIDAGGGRFSETLGFGKRALTRK